MSTLGEFDKKYWSQIVKTPEGQDGEAQNGEEKPPKDDDEIVLEFRN